MKHSTNKIKYGILFYFFIFSIFGQNLSKKDIIRLENQAKKIEIIRDNWGIAHVYGKTDADAVFGMLYAQCEDDFFRVEMNYIEKLGRLSEIKGKTYLFNDLEIKLLIDKQQAKNDYQKAEPWLKKLLDSYADGINYFLYKNPKIKPVLLNHFEPWFPLLWTDGSIGAINTADLSTKDLQDFYGQNKDEISYFHKEKDMQTGSNGFAIAPSKSESGNAMLYINPHTTFYFRPEIQMKSEEGLNTYGAVTWGQFFIYQGFNENCGWMHTSSNVDVADMYQENIQIKNSKYYYKFNEKWIPVQEKIININYLENGKILKKDFKTYFTHNGPIMAEKDGKWISLKSENRSMKSLIQSWIRTKSKNFDEYKSAMNLKANASNNTIYADNKGNIAYWHGNFIPKRDPKLNWSKIIDGTTSKTEWKGLHEVSEMIHLYNPKNGWLQNCNSTPFSVAGNNSPKKENYPNYMAPDGENYRGINAVRVLSSKNKFNLNQLIEAGYDSKLLIFEELIPALITNFDKNIKTNNPLYNQLFEPINELKKWDYYSNENSIATTLANEWAFKLNPILQKVYINDGEKDQIENTKYFIQNASSDDLILPFKEILENLQTKFGTWKITWGEINRYQRNSGEIDLIYKDSDKSIPIGYSSGLWGSLPAYKSEYTQNTKKRYGFNGNSFVCAVEFGQKIKAKSLLAGGNNRNPGNKHFNDQAEMYRKGEFKDIYFYKEDVQKNAERIYHPGE